MNKKYCINCRNFYFEHHQYLGNIELCLDNPEIISSYDTFVKKYANPKEKNKDNNCQFYKPFFWLMFHKLMIKIKKFILGENK